MRRRNELYLGLALGYNLAVRMVRPALLILFFAITAFASEIREFDIKTLQRLGNESPDGKMWQVANGKMSIDKSEAGSATMGSAARKAFQKYGK